MPYGVISPPNGESRPYSRNLLANHLNEISYDRLPLENKSIFFFGFARYETIFHDVYRMGFCFFYSIFDERWVLAGGQEYNYCSKEE